MTIQLSGYKAGTFDPIGMITERITIDGEDADDSRHIGADRGIEDVRFILSDGTKRYDLLMYHEQDCCEAVRLIDASGSWQDMIGKPIVRFDEMVNPPNATEPDDEWVESYTWTFYDIATAPTGYVTLRWLGESNGYYSESVDFRLKETA